jgi:hypothetical protein
MPQHYTFGFGHTKTRGPGVSAMQWAAGLSQRPDYKYRMGYHDVFIVRQGDKRQFSPDQAGDSRLIRGGYGWNYEVRSRAGVTAPKAPVYKPGIDQGKWQRQNREYLSYQEEMKAIDRFNREGGSGAQDAGSLGAFARSGPSTRLGTDFTRRYQDYGQFQQAKTTYENVQIQKQEAAAQREWEQVMSDAKKRGAQTPYWRRLGGEPRVKLGRAGTTGLAIGRKKGKGGLRIARSGSGANIP